MKDADTMPVPASYNDLKEGTDFRDHYGWVFYQRNISVPEYVKSQRIVLRCAAVTHYAMIYLNGKLICEHKGGFLPFEVELMIIYRMVIISLPLRLIMLLITQLCQLVVRLT